MIGPYITSLKDLWEKLKAFAEALWTAELPSMDQVLGVVGVIIMVMVVWGLFALVWMGVKHCATAAWRKWGPKRPMTDQEKLIATLYPQQEIEEWRKKRKGGKHGR